MFSSRSKNIFLIPLLSRAMNYIATLQENGTTVTNIWANETDDKLMISFFVFFSQKIGFELSRKLYAKETICMKYQIPYST